HGDVLPTLGAGGAEPRGQAGRLPAPRRPEPRGAARLAPKTPPEEVRRALRDDPVAGERLHVLPGAPHRLLLPDVPAHGEGAAPGRAPDEDHRRRMAALPLVRVRHEAAPREGSEEDPRGDDAGLRELRHAGEPDPRGGDSLTVPRERHRACPTPRRPTI